MSAKEADYYDADVRAGGLATLRLVDSPWLPLYVRAREWIPTGDPVFDLGCGTGRFAAALLASGHAAPYLGFDFSPASIEEARICVYDPLFEFHVADLRDFVISGPISGATIFTCLEVLEHLDDDLGLVECVPSGHRFVFSVPSFPSESHVRHFPHAGVAFDRYAPLLDFVGWRAIDMSPPDGRRIHLFDTRRRGDSWR